MPQHASGLHHHGYVERVSMTAAMTAVDRRRHLDPVEVMHRPEEVATWLVATVCHAMGKSDVDGNWEDERKLWAELASQGETIVTGVAGGPTITAEAVHDPACDCERQLVAVPSTKKTRR
jgi:hypothetical protein